MTGPAVDGRGVAVELAEPPRRIVSLVPSTTETLHALGLADRVVGITRFCVRPRPWVDGLPKVGGTKDVDADRVRALQPDLILGNCEENSREIFAALDGLAPLWAAFPRDVDGAIEDLLATARVCHVAPRGRLLADTIRAARDALRASAERSAPFTYAALIWRKPLMSASDDTFLAAMLAEAGGRNVFGDRPARFPEISGADLGDVQPDVVLLLSEPFPFKPKHADALAAATGLARARFRFVDGQHLTWHGVRMADSFAALTRALDHGFDERPSAD